MINIYEIFMIYEKKNPLLLKKKALLSESVIYKFTKMKIQL